MAKKLNIDFKKILLEKGERIGLGVAAGFMVLLLLLGAWTGLGKESPLGPLQGKLDFNTTKLEKDIKNTRFDSSKFATPSVAQRGPGGTMNLKDLEMQYWFERENPENTKKRNPKILAMRDFEVQYLRVPVRIIERTEKTVNMIAEKGAEGEFAEQIDPTRMVVISAIFPYGEELKLYVEALRAKGAEELKERPQFLGLQVYRRTTLPTGKVKMIRLEGDKESEWEDLMDESRPASFLKLLTKAADIVPEDAKVAEYAIPGLTMPRPALAGVAVYPLLKYLKGIPAGAAPKPADLSAGGRSDGQTVVKNIDDLADEKKERLTGTFKIFDPFSPFPKKGVENNQAPKPSKEFALCRFIDVDVQPGNTYDYTILIRATNPNYQKFDDVAAEKFADPPELLSAEYNYIPHVVIPEDRLLYVADEMAMNKDYNRKNAMTGAEALYKASQERVALQIHRWVDKIENQNRAGSFNLGEWLIAERLLVRRGEFIGKPIYVDVPEWQQKTKQYVLQNPEKSRGRPSVKGLQVDFTLKREQLVRPALLIDFQGGRVPSYSVSPSGRQKQAPVVPTDESAAEVLILTPEGKLMVQNGITDTDTEQPEGSDRLKRYEAWRSRISHLKPKKEGTKEENPFGSKKPK